MGKAILLLIGLLVVWAWVDNVLIDRPTASQARVSTPPTVVAGVVDIKKAATSVSVVAATATPEPVPTETPESAQAPIVLKGKGTNTERITLAPGLWTVAIRVVGNLDCSIPGFCHPGNFIVQVESVNDDRLDYPANEIGEEWEGSATVRVGDGLMDLAPGHQIVSVKAVGTWTIQFTNEQEAAGAKPSPTIPAPSPTRTAEPTPVPTVVVQENDSPLSSLSSLPDTERNYVVGFLASLLVLACGLEELTPLLENPQRGDDQWKEETAKYMGIVRLSYQAVKGLQPPAKSRSKHEQSLITLGIYDKAMDDLSYGIDHDDPQRIDRATERIREAHRELDKVLETLRDLQ